MTIYLYVKLHTTTGLKYFGKTIQKDPFKYLGSGIRWVNNFKKHGKEHIKTLEVWGFDNIELCSEFASKFSKDNNIVESPEWANLKYEDGKDGGFIHMKRPSHSLFLKERFRESPQLHPMLGKTGELNPFYGKKHSDSSRKLMSEKAKVKAPMSDETKIKISNYQKGKPKSEETKQKMRKPKPEGFSEKLSNFYKGKKQPTTVCNHCEKIGSVSNMKRWHFDNCKLKSL